MYNTKSCLTQNLSMCYFIHTLKGRKTTVVIHVREMAISNSTRKQEALKFLSESAKATVQLLT